MRGEFIFADGTVIPNNVLKEGRKALLEMALRGIDTVAIPAAGNFFVGLCTGVPSDDVLYTEIAEPTIGVEGYARQAVTRDANGWLTVGEANGEPFVETEPIVFTATGAGFDKPITRLFLGKEATAQVGNIWSLSAPLPSSLTILPSTPVGNRTFVYRLYMR